MQAEAGPGQWFTIAEAAPLLGVSVDTVRRRIKRGQIEARQVHMQHGPTWEVALGELQKGSAVEPRHAAEGAAEGPSMLEALRLVDRLQRENRDLSVELGYLRAQLAAAEDRIRMLEAPKPHQSLITQNLTAEAPDPPSEPSGPPSPAPMPPSSNGSEHAPWWRRWWLGVIGPGLLGLVIASSCQGTGGAKHAGVCTLAKQAMDAAASPGFVDALRPGPTQMWGLVDNLTSVAEKTC